jgi:transcription elongation factor GreA
VHIADAGTHQPYQVDPTVVRRGNPGLTSRLWVVAGQALMIYADRARSAAQEVATSTGILAEITMAENALVGHHLPTSLRQALTERLRSLHADRQRTRAELGATSGCGDAADRCVNVELTIMLEDLDSKIGTLERQLQHGSTNPTGRSTVGGQPRVRIGSRVTVAFDGDDGVEVFLLAPMDCAEAGADIVTPHSPLGRALQTARPGDRVCYRSDARHEVCVSVLSVEQD